MRSGSVSPAPAGIDLRRIGIKSPGAGLPRTRGDRPIDPTSLEDVMRSPPHPRGSTFCGEGGDLAAHVSPAPAGIDPCGSTRRLPRRSLPRTRGDRPWGQVVSFFIAESPPHPRGSTRYRGARLFLGHVSPAPAGIDPVGGLRCRFPDGLPRTRGDRPASTKPWSMRRASPPHPRGSTAATDRRLGCLAVSPAPAGIDPESLAMPDRKTSLPRTRGDRP